MGGKAAIAIKYEGRRGDVLLGMMPPRILGPCEYALAPNAALRPASYMVPVSTTKTPLEAAG